MSTIEWKNLGFAYIKTNCHVKASHKDGKWSALEVVQSDKIEMSIAATCLHYGQECFEGLKAFTGKDGQIRVFRPDENAKRMIDTANYMLMPIIPIDIFIDAVRKVVTLNKEFVPPYSSGASLYIRPFLCGTGETIGVSASPEYTFIILVTPVGPYFKGGFQTMDVIIKRQYDRAAPNGTGHIKVGGNYGASLKANYEAKHKGFSSVLYLDPKEKKYIDECGQANFFAIKGKSYITPKSNSILPSITNMSLKQLAKDMGLNVEERHIPLEELAEFDEAGACGTAAVISPINIIVDEDSGRIYKFGTEPGKISTALFKKLQGIQYGDEPDNHNWNIIL